MQCFGWLCIRKAGTHTHVAAKDLVHRPCKGVHTCSPRNLCTVSASAWPLRRPSPVLRWHTQAHHTDRSWGVHRNAMWPLATSCSAARVVLLLACGKGGARRQACCLGQGGGVYPPKPLQEPGLEEVMLRWWLVAFPVRGGTRPGTPPLIAFGLLRRPRTHT